MAAAVQATSVEEQKSEQQTQELATVFVDPKNFTVKHPLASKWSLWYDSPSRKRDPRNWHDNLKHIIVIGTVEDFWCVINNIPIASELVMGSNYHLFREGVRPEWEDVGNKNGGKWVCPVQRKERAKLDESWLNVMTAMIGESFENSDEICGAVISIRKAVDRIAIWTKTAAKIEETKSVGKEFKEMVQCCAAKTNMLTYQVHKDASSNNSSFNNTPLYEL